MKQLTILILVVILSSCCGTKKAIENAPKPEQKDIAEVVTPEKPETPKVTETITEDIPSQVETPQVETPETLESPKAEEVEIIDNYNTEAFNHNRWNTLLQENVTNAGNVDYRAFKNNRSELQVYIDALGENMPNNNWSKEDKLAYWINAYNAMTVDLIVRNYPIKSIKDIDDPWKQRFWKLGEKWYNLDEIEHQILRKMDEPRIHFGIVWLIDFINQYSDVQVSNSAKKSFKDYNWDLNE